MWGMQSIVFLRGIAIGFALAAPIGPVGILCIRRALADGRHAAFIAGLGAAFADTFFGAVAVFGVTAVASFLNTHQETLRVIGGMFLLTLGIVTMMRRPAIDSQPLSRRGLVRDFVSTFLITLTNPATILASMGVFAAWGALGEADTAASSILIGGVFAGSTLWWAVLSGVAGAARAKVSHLWLARFNQGSGLILVASGALMLTLYFFK